MIAVGAAGFSSLLLSCNNADGTNQTGVNITEKASSQLIAQVELRREQIAEPTPERTEVMKSMGMSLDKLDVQRIFIYMEQAPTAAQIEELQELGLTLYPDSWIPPVGTHPAGFFIADMPVDKLEALSGKEYIVKLDTAEQQLQPQNSASPQ